MSVAIQECAGGLTGMPTERLEAEITRLATQIAAATCRLLLYVAELDRRGAWASWGAKSCAHWLNYQCGIDMVTAREKVRVAHAVCELPLIRAAFAVGELAYSKVRALTRVATPDTEAELLEIARDTSTAQLERILRGYAGTLAADDKDTAAAHLRRSLTWRVCENGDGVVELRCPPEDLALILGEVNERMAPSGDDDMISQRRYDALRGLIDAGIAADAGDGQASVVANIVIQADIGVLTGDDESGAAHTDDGHRLARGTLRRLACDCAVDLIVERDGEILDSGRRTRTIPPALRRAVLARDGHCTFPGCADRIAEIHHLRHWAHGGHTNLTNTGGLCRRHHWQVHEGGFEIGRAEDGEIRVFRPDGRELVRNPRPAPAEPGDLADDGLDPRAIEPRRSEDRIDVAYIVSCIAPPLETRFT